MCKKANQLSGKQEIRKQQRPPQSQYGMLK